MAAEETLHIELTSEGSGEFTRIGPSWIRGVYQTWILMDQVSLPELDPRGSGKFTRIGPSWIR